jgi:hypothetical protein
MQRMRTGRAQPLLAPALVFAAALALRCFRAGEPLWHDEAYSFHLARLSWPDLIDQLRAESTPPLYYLLLKLWIAVFGDSEIALRSLSALCSAATAGLACAFGSRFLSQRVGWCFGLLLAVDPSAFYYGREARMYALWELLALLGLWGAVWFARDSSRGGLVLAAVAQLLACFTHNVALFGVASTALATLLFLEGRRARATWSLVHAGVGLLYLPWFFVVLSQLAQQSVVLAWFTPHWQDQSALWHVADSIAALTTGAFPNWMGLSSPWSARLPSAAVALLLAASAAFALRRERVARIFALSALGFVLLCVAYSAAVQPIFIPGRTDRALLAPLLFLVAVHVDLEPGRRARTAGVAAWGLLCLALLLYQYGAAPKSAAAPVWAALGESVQPGDVVVSAGLAAGQAAYVHHRSHTRSVFEFFPVSAGRHVGYTSFRTLQRQREALRAEARASASRWAAALGSSGRLWLVWSGDPEFAPLEAALREHFRLEATAARGVLPLIGDPVELRAYRPVLAGAR